MAVRKLPKDVLKMAFGLISLSGLAGHCRPLCIALCLPVVGHQPHVVAEQRGDAQAEQQRHEEHEQKVVPATKIYEIIL